MSRQISAALAIAPRPSGFDSAPPTLAVGITPTDRGNVYSVRAADGRNASVMISTAELNHVEGAHQIDVAVNTLAQRFEQNSSRFLGAELQARNYSDAQSILLRAASFYLSNALKQKIGITAELAKFAQVPPHDSFVEAQIRGETRKMLRESSASVQTQIIGDADFRTLAAIVEAPALLSGLNPDVHKIAVDRLTFANIARAFGIAANFANQPDLQNPLATGVDQGAVEEEASAVIKRKQEKLDAAELAGLTVSRIALFVAVACDKQPDEIFNAIAGS